MINTIEIKWDLLGAKLAALSDAEQAQFFTGFARELASWESSYIVDRQILSIRDKMLDKDRLKLSEHLPCLWEAYND